MIQNPSFRRKVLYLGAIALLLIPLYVLGHPAAGDPTNQEVSRPGGQLAQLRADYGLSPAELGEIDPAGESMKLATLGLRGVAAQILWTKANGYKRTENWEKMIATVKQMAKLQPHFISVWEFQSHNLSYNISVEHDDYRFRYLWVKKGIEFQIQGTRYNRKEPRLYHSVGWFTGQKFGRADEYRQFRRLFQDDGDFHNLMKDYLALADMDRTRGARGKPDNWLVSRLWFYKAYDVVDTLGAVIRGKAPHIFYVDGPKARMNYAVAVQGEGYFADAGYAWRQSSDEWRQYGARQVPTSQGLIIRLNDEESLREEADRLKVQLDELVPGAREAITQEKRAKLTPAQREALDTPIDEIMDAEVYDLHYHADQQTQVTPREIALRAADDVKARANRIANRIMKVEYTALWIDKYRSNVAFEYWRARADIEQLPETVKGRELVYNAKQKREAVELEAARQLYEQAWDEWDKIFAENPGLLSNLAEDDLMEDVREYVDLVVNQLEQKLPANFTQRGFYQSLPAEMRESIETEASTAPPAPAEDTPAEDTPTSPADAADDADAPADKSKPPADEDADDAPADKPDPPADEKAEKDAADKKADADDAADGQRDAPAP